MVRHRKKSVTVPEGYRCDQEHSEKHNARPIKLYLQNIPLFRIKNQETNTLPLVFAA